jgi:hypothetical protein
VQFVDNGIPFVTAQRLLFACAVTTGPLIVFVQRLLLTQLTRTTKFETKMVLKCFVSDMSTIYNPRSLLLKYGLELAQLGRMPLGPNFVDV